MTQQERMIECDMLKGNINRMMVTDDVHELFNMFNWACKRLSKLFDERKKDFEVRG